MNNKRSIAAMTLLVQVMLSCGSVTQEIVKFSTNANHCFRKDMFVAADLIEFCTNGTYRFIDRQHMGIREADHGTWKQAEGGEITLFAEKRFRDVAAEPLRIFVFNEKDLIRLPAVKKKILGFLEGRNAKEFSPYQVQRLYEAIMVDVRSERISRAQLEKLAQAIDEYLNSSQKQVFHVTPVKHGNGVFLVWKEDVNSDLSEVEQATKSRAAMLKGGLPSVMFESISQEEFDREVTKKYPFKHVKMPCMEDQ